MDRLEFTSSFDNAVLTFEIINEDHNEKYFDVTVRSGPFSGSSNASTYFVGPPSIFFNEMEKYWRGWEGKKVWADVESRVCLEAMSDLAGFICLTVTLNDVEHDNSVTILFKCKNENVIKMAIEMKKLFL